MPSQLLSRFLRCSPLLLLSAALALPAAAQYRTPGSSIEITENRRTQLETAIEDARWSLGSVRVQPWIGIEDLAYQDPVQTPEGPTDDIHASIGAGLKFYLPVGSDTFVAAHALPEYSFWMDLDDRNQLLGRYGIGVFTFLNRLEFELTGRQEEQVRFLSDEVLRSLPQTNETLEAKAQLRVAGSLAIAVSGRQRDWDAEEFDDQDNVLPIQEPGNPDVLLPTDPGFLIDREETTLRAGVRYLLRGEGGHVGIGIQEEETRFDLASGRDSDGSSLYAEALLRGNKMDIGFDIVQRDLKPTASSAFPGYDGTSGGVLVVFHPRSSSDLQLYARRDLSYSAVNGANYYETSVYGIGTRLRLSHRSDLTGFYETGSNEYFANEAIALPDEDTTAWGATLSYELGRSLNIRMGYDIRKYDSEGGLRAREVEQISIGLSLGTASRGAW